MIIFHFNRRVLSYVEIVGVAAAGVVILSLFFHAWSIRQRERAATIAQESALIGRQIFPADDPWNTDISAEPVDGNSNAVIASIGVDEPLHADFGSVYHSEPFGIPYVIVSADQPKVPVTFLNAVESDAGLYPIPPDAPVEGGRNSHGDRHLLIVDKSSWMLYELYAAYTNSDGGWQAGSGAIFDLSKNSVQRHPGFTSADAAGLPIFPGLARYDEVIEQGRITHALRFTVQRTRRGFIYPASRFASRNTDENLPPMGMRVRLKRDFDLSTFPPCCRVILQGLKTYGMILADNGGNWFISGAPDPRWNDRELEMLKNVKGSDFEVVRMGEIATKLVSFP
ncbi:MAG TPA: hypothetical protein VKK61_11730 [Tepidisphaeraceae bacterium]|nr:hypothetical protein [Tepidisphaeraceae bacterium]